VRSILEAIDLVPLGATLLECPTLRVVAQNDAAINETWGEYDAVRDACDGVDEVVPVETKQGWCGVSRLPGGPDLARPDLVLVTFAGSGKTSTFAMLAHRRAVALLSVSEETHRTALMLEDALVHVRAAIDAQRRMAEEARRTSAAIVALLRDTPECGRT
jgi:hypothetical protein